MPRDNITPDPIPVNYNIDLGSKDFCASYMSKNNSTDTNNEIKKSLLEYLNNEYSCCDMPQRMNTYIAYNENVDDVFNQIMNGIEGLTCDNIDSIVGLIKHEDDVIISVY